MAEVDCTGRVQHHSRPRQERSMWCTACRGGTCARTGAPTCSMSSRFDANCTKNQPELRRTPSATHHVMLVKPS
jgi:hypothetical protein